MLKPAFVDNFCKSETGVQAVSYRTIRSRGKTNRRGETMVQYSREAFVAIGQAIAEGENPFAERKPEELIDIQEAISDAVVSPLLLAPGEYTPEE